MAAITSSVPPLKPNRRRRVRHKIQTPAYASFTTEAKPATLDLYEVVDISEEGISIQCPAPLEVDREVTLCLDLAECSQQIYTCGKVIWSTASGRAGLHFSDLPSDSLFRLREWLFLNAMAGVANTDIPFSSPVPQTAPPKPSYTDTLAAITAVQREVEGRGADLDSALQLIASRTQSLVRASGVALALATDDPDYMKCRATAGSDAPPVGVRLQVGSGFSGECVKTGRLLVCNDTETDSRVDRESCRALGIRSILAAPVRVGAESVGILEAFSPMPGAFDENDTRILQRLADTVLAAMHRSRGADDEAPADHAATQSFATPQGSVLFASAPEQTTDGRNNDQRKNDQRKNDQRKNDQRNNALQSDDDADAKTSGISLPRSHLVLLMCFAATIAAALGYLSAPLIQSKLEHRGKMQMQTVLASTHAPRPEPPSALSITALENMPTDQLRQLASSGDPVAENVLGLRYFQGDPKYGVKLDENEAARWFLSAAEHGNVAAQSKLGFLYWSGRGVPKDVNKAYLWTVVACSHSADAVKDPAVFLSKNLSQVLKMQLTHDQAAAVERQAQQWLQTHDPAKKPSADSEARVLKPTA